MNNVEDFDPNKDPYEDIKKHSNIVRSLSICIQALQTAIQHHNFLCQSDTVDKDDYEEGSFMYEGELSRLVKIYKEEEKLGYTHIPLKELLVPPFDELIDMDL